MNPSEERIKAVAEAIYEPCCDGVSTVEDVAKVALAAADATRPKPKVTEAMVNAFEDGARLNRTKPNSSERRLRFKGLEAALKEMA